VVDWEATLQVAVPKSDATARRSGWEGAKKVAPACPSPGKTKKQILSRMSAKYRQGLSGDSPSQSR